MTPPPDPVAALRDVFWSDEAEAPNDPAEMYRRLLAAGWSLTRREEREALDRLAWCAVRYGLGRHTYVTAHIAESVARVKDSLREDTRRIIVTDIDRAEERDGLGDSVDAGVWRGLRTALAPSPSTEAER